MTRKVDGLSTAWNSSALNATKFSTEHYWVQTDSGTLKYAP